MTVAQHLIEHGESASVYTGVVSLYLIRMNLKFATF